MDARVKPARRCQRRLPLIAPAALPDRAINDDVFGGAFAVARRHIDRARKRRELVRARAAASVCRVRPRAARLQRDYRAVPHPTLASFAGPRPSLTRSPSPRLRREPGALVEIARHVGCSRGRRGRDFDTALSCLRCAAMRRGVRITVPLSAFADDDVLIIRRLMMTGSAAILRDRDTAATPAARR